MPKCAVHTIYNNNILWYDTCGCTISVCPLFFTQTAENFGLQINYRTGVYDSAAGINSHDAEIHGDKGTV